MADSVEKILWAMVETDLKLKEKRKETAELSKELSSLAKDVPKNRRISAVQRGDKTYLVEVFEDGFYQIQELEVIK